MVTLHQLTESDLWKDEEKSMRSEKEQLEALKHELGPTKKRMQSRTMQPGEASILWKREEQIRQQEGQQAAFLTRKSKAMSKAQAKQLLYKEQRDAARVAAPAPGGLVLLGSGF